MKKALEPAFDREEAIISVPPDRTIRRDFGREIELDLRNLENEYESDMFPVWKLFDSAEWRQGHNAFWQYNAEKLKLFNTFETEVIKRFEQYQVPLIKLTKETPKEAVCLVFEKVNTGGVSLTVFELVTASFAAENFQLRDDWEKKQDILKNGFPVLSDLQNTDFLQIISLLSTQERKRAAVTRGLPSDKLPGISCKRRDILRMTLEEYQRWADRAVDGLERAARFLHQQKIFRSKDVPYRTQIVPLAAILADLGLESESDGVRRKIAHWYWCGVLGELYGSAIESRFAKDLPEVVDFIRRDLEATTITDAIFTPARLLTLRTRNSAAYKGIYALLMRDGCLDFRTGEPIEAQTFFDDQIDIHHIFPQKWCTDSQIDSQVYNSIVNKTAISARTNRQIGGRAPSKYLQAVATDASIPDWRLDEILVSHKIEPSSLQSDDFHAFFQNRAQSLLQVISQAMGKSISGDQSVFESLLPTDEYEDEETDWNELEAALF
jgi:hypothetical protein